MLSTRRLTTNASWGTSVATSLSFSTIYQKAAAWLAMRGQGTLRYERATMLFQSRKARWRLSNFGSDASSMASGQSCGRSNIWRQPPNRVRHVRRRQVRIMLLGHSGVAVAERLRHDDQRRPVAHHRARVGVPDLVQGHV